MHTQSNRLIFVRKSPHDGSDHEITVDARTLRPFGCTCVAGHYDRLCWAVINLAADELVPIAYDRWRRACGEVDIRTAAQLVVRTRAWAVAARQALVKATSPDWVETNEDRLPLVRT